jgi:hypothetical protein
VEKPTKWGEMTNVVNPNQFKMQNKKLKMAISPRLHRAEREMMPKIYI